MTVIESINSCSRSYGKFLKSYWIAYRFVCLFIYLGNDCLPPKETLMKFPTNTWQKLAWVSGKEGRRWDSRWYLEVEKMTHQWFNNSEFQTVRLYMLAMAHFHCLLNFQGLQKRLWENNFLRKGCVKETLVNSSHGWKFYSTCNPLWLQHSGEEVSGA